MYPLSSVEAHLSPCRREKRRVWKGTFVMAVFVGTWVWFYFSYAGAWFTIDSRLTKHMRTILNAWSAFGLGVSAGIAALVGTFVVRFMALNTRKAALGTCALRWGSWGIEQSIDGVVWTGFSWDGVRATTTSATRRIRPITYNAKQESRRGPTETVSTVHAIRFTSPNGDAISVFPIDQLGGSVMVGSMGWFHRGLPCLARTYVPKLMAQARAAGVEFEAGRVDGSGVAAGRILVPFIPEQWRLGAALAALLSSAWLGALFDGWPGKLLGVVGILLLGWRVRDLVRQLFALRTRPGSGERVTLVSGNEEQITVRSREGKTRMVDLTGVACGDAFIHKRADVDILLTVAAGDANPYRGGIERATRIEPCNRAKVYAGFAHAVGIELVGASTLVFLAVLLSFPNLF